MTPAAIAVRLARLAAERAQAEAFQRGAQTNHERRAAWEMMRWYDRQQWRLMQEVDTMTSELMRLRTTMEEYMREASGVQAALARCTDADDLEWLTKVLAGWNTELARVSAAIARLEAEDVSHLV